MPLSCTKYGKIHKEILRHANLNAWGSQNVRNSGKSPEEARRLEQKFGGFRDSKMLIFDQKRPFSGRPMAKNDQNEEKCLGRPLGCGARFGGLECSNGHFCFLFAIPEPPQMAKNAQNKEQYLGRPLGSGAELGGFGVPNLQFLGRPKLPNMRKNENIHREALRPWSPNLGVPKGSSLTKATIFWFSEIGLKNDGHRMGDPLDVCG